MDGENEGDGGRYIENPDSSICSKWSVIESSASARPSLSIADIKTAMASFSPDSEHGGTNPEQQDFGLISFRVVVTWTLFGLLGQSLVPDIASNAWIGSESKEFPELSFDAFVEGDLLM